MAFNYERLLSALSNSEFQKKDNALYQTVKNLIKAAQDLNDRSETFAAEITNIINTITPSDTVEDLDGTNDPGTSDSYSRGDHKHDYGINSINYNRIQQVSAASKLLGHGDSGAGDVEEISLGTNLSITGTTLNASGGISSDYVVASDGVVVSPSPINDGAGNFIYVGYTAP